MINEKHGSIYARRFNCKSVLWREESELNRTFFRAMQTYFNEVLQARGYVFLRDIYEKLGIPIDYASIVCGWIYDYSGKNPNGDNFVSIEFEEIEGEDAFMLDFNVDGEILDHFKRTE